MRTQWERLARYHGKRIRAVQDSRDFIINLSTDTHQIDSFRRQPTNREVFMSHGLGDWTRTKFDMFGHGVIRRVNQATYVPR